MVMDIFTLQSYADIDIIRYVAICIALMLFLPMWMYWDKDSVIFVGEVLRCKWNVCLYCKRWSGQKIHGEDMDLHKLILQGN